MNAFAQIAKWPPTTSTVIGIGLVLGGLDWLITGSIAQAVFVAGVFKILCPEDAAAADKLDQVLEEIPAIQGAAK